MLELLPAISRYILQHEYPDKRPFVLSVERADDPPIYRLRSRSPVR